MALIHIAAAQTDDLLTYLTEEDFWGDERLQDLEKNRDTYIFKTLQKHGQHLGKRNKAIIPAPRGYAEFIIDDVVARFNDEYEVRTTASYQELKHRAIIYPETLSEYGPSQAVGHALDGTGWIPGMIQGEASYRTFNIEEHTNPYNFLKSIAAEFKLELKFRVEIDGNKVVGRYVDLLDRVGKWRGYEVTYGYNMTGLERREKSTDIVTALLGVGPADTEGNQKTVPVTNEDARKKWGWINPDTGEREHLIDVYFPDSARQDMPESELRTYTENELEKRIKSKYEYKTDFATLSQMLGGAPEIGDTVWVKNEDFNPPLYLEARVHTLKGGIKKNSNTQATLGDYVAFTEAEARSTFRDLQKQINAKIDDAQLRNYTYAKLTIDNKDTTVFEEGKTFAELQGQTAEDNAKRHADTVASQAEQNAKDHADTAAGQALIDAQNYAVAQTVYDNKMTEIANDLSEKSDIEYVDGQLVDKANKGDVYTIDETDNMLLNYVGKTTYETDMDGVVQDLDSHETRLGQNETAIGLKADSSRVDTLEGTVEDHSAEINVMSDEISQKVEADYVQGEIDALQVGVRNYFVLKSASTYSDHATLDSIDGTLLTLTAQSTEDLNLTIRSEYELEGGTDYVISGFAKLNGNPIPSDFFINPNTRGDITVKDIHVSDGYFEIKIHANSLYPWFLHARTMAAEGDTITIDSLKLEKGNKATDWTPAPEDTQAQIDDLDVTVSSHSTQITQNADAITSKAEASVVDTLTGRVSSAESTIQQQADEIDARVEKDGVIAAINLTSEMATIDANKINLVGAVTVLSDITGDLGSITAGDIRGVNIIGAEILQEGNAGSIELKDTGLHTFDADGMERITINTTDDVFQGYSPSIITFEPEMPDYTFLVATGGYGLGDAYIGFPDREGTPSFERLFQIQNKNGRLRLDAGEIEILSDIKAFGLRRFIATEDVTLRSENEYAYVQSPWRLRVTEPGTATSYVPVNASNFNNVSLERMKQDIQLMSESALDVINTSDIYKYHLKHDVKNDVYEWKHGFVIGDGYNTPEEVMQGDDSISQYDMSAYLWKGVQELSSMQQNNADDINWLKMENELLKARVNKLEEAS